MRDLLLPKNVTWRYNGLLVNDRQWSSIAAGYLVI